MPEGPTADASVGAQTDSTSFDTFSGLRNTVLPERMGPRELTRARNIDLDDEGQPRRRRGYRKALLGNFHSLYCTSLGFNVVVKDGVLVRLEPDYSVTPILAGIGPDYLSYVEVAGELYFRSWNNSGVVHLYTPDLAVTPWCRTVDPSFQPGLDPAPVDFWLSPVAKPEQDAGMQPVAGRLIGPPPVGRYATLYNGRIYLASGRELWGTELYAFRYVDKTKGYRYYEDEITGLMAVEDGIYVGTTKALYFVSGKYGEETRVFKENAGVIPGTMILVAGEIVNPEGKRRPDIPQQNQKAMSCMTDRGLVVGLGSGSTFNLTRTSFVFPQARRGAAFFREQDGMHTIINALDSGGTPRDNAAIGDYVDTMLIRKGVIVDADRPGLVGRVYEPSINPGNVTIVQQTVIYGSPPVGAKVVGMDGTVLGDLSEDNQ